MPNSSPFVTSVNELLAKLEDNSTIDTAIELANQIVSLFGDVHTKSVEDVFESSIELPNAERYDSWFQPHPIFKSDRACFDLADSPLLQAKFYWLKKRSRQIIAGGVHFTPNYEDEEFTHNERYKVGLDFFLSPNGKSLQVVLSNRGNLRIVELAGRLNNTQKEIFEKWLGAGSLHTQEALHTTLWESFKLKSVNQKFYDGVSNSFTELLQHLKSIDKDEEEAKLFASRLLGRLLFCWFLRKKGIIDESIGYFNAHGTDATAYYKQSLERLFFLTLNTPTDERDELTKQHQKALFPELLVDDQPSLFKTDQKTPYLNGGLFEPHENDWYKDDSLTLPEGFFTKLYDHFEEFNFTTDESSPEYEQIAIDPEMLGRVFESLLATQVDETGQQARKAKGAFYTPREIVSYMCKESLRNYLYSEFENDEVVGRSIDNLLDRSDKEWSIAGTNSIRDSVPKEYRSKLLDSLDKVRIFDPACGSGAFPMGMLQLMFKTYERLESRFDSYKTKLSVIQNNIFGVDIEPMAVEISRLRAWLSLIVDEDDPHSVDPLPNLDFKFVCANSLIPLDKEVGLFSDSSLHQKLKDIRTKYFNARKKHTKKLLQDEYYKLTSSEQTSLITDDARTKQLKSFDPFKNSKPANFYDNDHMFGLQNGFNIIIANPPYIKNSRISKLDKSTYLNLYQTPFDQWDIYILFFELAMNCLDQKGIACFISPNQWLSAKYGTKLRRLIVHNVRFLADFRKYADFENASVNTFVSLFTKDTTHKDLDVIVFNSGGSFDTNSTDRDSVIKSVDNLGAILSEHSKIISNIKARFSSTVGLHFKVGHSFSIPDFYKLSSLVYEEQNADTSKEIKLVSTGTLSLLGSKYGSKPFKYDGKKYSYPVVRRDDFVSMFPTRAIQLKPKLIISSMGGLNIDIDIKGEFLGTRPTMWLAEKDETDLRIAYALLGSKFISWFYSQQYSVAGMTGFKVRYSNIQDTPFPKFSEVDKSSLIRLVNEVLKLVSMNKIEEANTLWEEINHIIYRSYELTEEEISEIERSAK